MNECQEVQVQFLIPGADPAEAFDPLEQVLDVVALAVGNPAVRPRIFSIAPWRDARFASHLINAPANVIAIETSVGHDAFPLH